MQGMMGMNPQIPTIKELWKNEKSKYRHWVIILAIGLLAILSLSLASFILNLTNRTQIINTLQEQLIKDKAENPQSDASTYFTRNHIVFPSLILIALLVGIIWYFISLVEVYKHKNFAKLSQWPTFIVGLGAFISIIGLMMYMFSRRANVGLFATQGSIFAFSNRIVYILVYFAASAPISRVRRLFIISDRLEQMKNDPHFQAMQGQMNNSMMQGGYMPNGPLGPVVARPGQSQQVPPTKTENEEVKEKIDPELERLKRLSIEKLREVALRLSISGYESMKKDELIEAIMRVSR